MFFRFLTRVVDWVKMPWQLSVEFGDRSCSTWVFVRTWKKNEFARVAVDVLDRYYGDPSSKLIIFGKKICASASGNALISLSGGWHSLVECYRQFLGSSYTKILPEYHVFDVFLLKRCLQETASVVFGTLDTFSMTEFFLSRAKGAKHRD